MNENSKGTVSPSDNTLETSSTKEGLSWKRINKIEKKTYSLYCWRTPYSARITKLSSTSFWQSSSRVPKQQQMLLKTLSSSFASIQSTNSEFFQKSYPKSVPARTVTSSSHWWTLKSYKISTSSKIVSMKPYGCSHRFSTQAQLEWCRMWTQQGWRYARVTPSRLAWHTSAGTRINGLSPIDSSPSALTRRASTSWHQAEVKEAHLHSVPVWVECASASAKLL